MHWCVSGQFKQSGGFITANMLRFRILPKLFENFGVCKGGFFFQKVRFVFQISKSRKKIFQKTILSLKIKFHANITLFLLAGNLNVRLRIVFWNTFIWRFGDLKKFHRTFWKKATFSCSLCYLVIFQSLKLMGTCWYYICNAYCIRLSLQPPNPSQKNPDKKILNTFA